MSATKPATSATTMVLVLGRLLGLVVCSIRRPPIGAPIVERATSAVNGYDAPSRVPTESGAEGFLNEVVAIARSGDFAALCEVGGGSCEDFLEQPGGREVPPAAPRIIGGRTIQPTSEGGGGSVGGYVLEICGTNAEGATYYSEMIVFFDFNGTLRGIEPTYWLGIRIADDNQAGPHLDEERASECP